MLGKRLEVVAPAVWVRCLFTRSRIPDSVFQPRPGDHEKYGGDPEQPHKIHVITRIKSVIGRPYWEKKIIHDLGLDKAHQPILHKNIPSVNSKLKVIKHLISLCLLSLLFPSCTTGRSHPASILLNYPSQIFFCSLLCPCLHSQRRKLPPKVGVSVPNEKNI
ncbi:large ribosomal subunit protein uL30m isoform 3-T3 [Amazona ochrocephala]